MVFRTMIRRWLCLALALVLLTACLPVSTALGGGTGSTADAEAPRVFSERDEALLRRDVFARIDGVVNAAAEKTGGTAALATADYCALLPQVRQAVEASGTYAPGTLRQKGELLTWETRDGFACCFDPRMEAVVRGAAAIETPAGSELTEPRMYADIAPVIAEGNDAAVPAAEASGDASLQPPADDCSGGTPVSPQIGFFTPFGYTEENALEPNFALYGPERPNMIHELCALTGGTATICHTGGATIDSLARLLENCGVVLIHTHGVTDYFDQANDDETSRANCSYLCLTTGLGVTAEDMRSATGPYGTYYYAMIGCGYAEVSGTAVANHMRKNAPHSLVYMTSCSVMATDGIAAPLRARGVEVLWGYSQPVYFRGDYLYFQAVFGGVCQGMTFGEAVAAAKQEYGCWDPAFPDYTLVQAIAEHTAFPIVVSSEDPYPGHDNVNAIQTVNAEWKLLGADCEVQAQPDDPAQGGVTVRGRFVYAEPAPGYKTAGWRLLSGSAAVSRDGDLFVVTPSSDCTLEICFAPKSPVTVTCLAGGETVAALETLEGEPVTLPGTGPECEDWSFLGWTGTPAPLAAEKPALLDPGAEYRPSGSLKLYALYSREIPDPEPVYRLVTAAPASWEGEYVFTTDECLTGRCVLSGLAGSNRSYLTDWDQGGPYFEDTGIEQDGDLLRKVESRYLFTVTEADGSYTIQSKAYGTYLANRMGELMTEANGQMLSARWELGFSGIKPTVHSLVNTRYTYLCYDRSYSFFLYDSPLDTLRLWRAEPGTRWLCTADPWAHTHSPGAAEEENRTEPTCTAPGGYDLTVRCAVCWAVVERSRVELPALGHDFEEWVTPPACEEPGFTTFTCRRCGHTETGDETEALGHDWKAPEYRWAEDLSAVTASRDCGRDAAHKETETAETTAEVVTEPTFEAEGELRYTAVFENPAFEPQARTVTIPKLERVNPFKDVKKNKYYYEPVLWAYYHEPQITSGIGETSFGPNQTCTRAQIVTFLWKAAGCPEPESAVNPFTDVKPEKYYYKAVLWAAEHDVTGGTGEGTFSPNKGCTRAQAVTFLWRFAGSPEPNQTENPFADVREGKYYYSAVLWAYYHEPQITSGVGESTFSPNASCSRGQIVTFLYKLMQD